MGSLGVTSGTLSGETVDALFGGRLNFEQPDDRYARPGADRAVVPDRINIFPSGKRDYGAFVIDFTNADTRGYDPTGNQRDSAQALRQSFLHAWRRPTNINTRNAEASYNSTYQDAIADGQTEAQARMSAEDARLAITRSALERFLSRAQANGEYIGVEIRDYGRRRG